MCPSVFVFVAVCLRVIGDFEMPDSRTIMEKRRLRLVAIRTCRSFVKPGLWESLGTLAYVSVFFLIS